MPRGVKGSGAPRKPAKSVDDRIAEIDAKIAQLNADKKALLATKEKEDLAELKSLMKKTGLKAADLLKLAQEKP